MPLRFREAAKVNNWKQTKNNIDPWLDIWAVCKNRRKKYDLHPKISTGSEMLWSLCCPLTAEKYWKKLLLKSRVLSFVLYFHFLAHTILRSEEVLWSLSASRVHQHSPKSIPAEGHAGHCMERLGSDQIVEWHQGVVQRQAAVCKRYNSGIHRWLYDAN